MNAKEKAKELMEKYAFVEIAHYTSLFEVKQCALIAVDEILDVDYFDMSEEHFENIMEYWEQVKQEIQQL